MFKGIITPIVTPFNRDYGQTINYEATETLINYLIKKGVNGIFALGSNGEFHVISKEEKIEFTKRVVEIADHRVPVFAGSGACSTKEAVSLSQEMEKAGADAVSVITPYFLKPTEEEVYEYFKDIADSITIPIVLYNIPKATGCNISSEVVKRLTAIENIKAIKDSSGDMANLEGYINAGKDTGLSVLVGSDSKISTGYKMGATGAIAGTSNVITDTLVGLDKALRNDDNETAEKLQQDIDVLRGVLKYGTVPSVIKRALELAEIANVGSARRPVMEASAEADVHIKEMLKYFSLF